MKKKQEQPRKYKLDHWRQWCLEIIERNRKTAPHGDTVKKTAAKVATREKISRNAHL